MVVARCPDCGIKTVPWHSKLTDDHMTCDGCWARKFQEALDASNRKPVPIMRRRSGNHRITVTTK